MSDQPDSIITLDVGGQMFKTQISILTKYPDSMLAIMFQHTANGLAPMPMTKDGAYFLDANPLYFGEILDYLRRGKIVSEDPNVLKGIKNLANYFRLEELIKELSVGSGSGKSMSEALIFASTYPQYDNRLFIELQVQYMKIPSSILGRTCCVQKLFLTFGTIFVHNMFSPCSAELLIKIYL